MMVSHCGSRERRKSGGNGTHRTPPALYMNATVSAFPVNPRRYHSAASVRRSHYVGVAK